MPDRDIVHSRLPIVFQAAYKQLCEGFYSEEQIAITTSGGLKQCIRRYGNGPVRYLIQRAAQLNTITIQQSLGQPISWADESRAIRSQAQLMQNTSKRAAQIAVEACSEVLQEIRTGKDFTDVTTSLMERYLDRALRAEFVDIIPLTSAHYTGISQAELDMRLARMLPHTQRHVREFAKQIAQGRDLHKLRLPRSKLARPTITLSSKIV